MASFRSVEDTVPGYRARPKAAGQHCAIVDSTGTSEFRKLSATPLRSWPKRLGRSGLQAVLPLAGADPAGPDQVGPNGQALSQLELQQTGAARRPSVHRPPQVTAFQAGRGGHDRVLWRRLPGPAPLDAVKGPQGGCRLLRTAGGGGAVPESDGSKAQPDG